MENNMKKYIEKATFSEIFNLVKDSKNESLLNAFLGVFKIGLLFLPRLLSPEYALMENIGNGVNLLGAAEGITSAVNNVFKYFKGKKYNDYKTRYDEMQIAHYLITYTAFFDTIKEYLPNESAEINLKGNEKVFITKEAIAEYQKT